MDIYHYISVCSDSCMSDYTTTELLWTYNNQIQLGLHLVDYSFSVALARLINWNTSMLQFITRIKYVRPGIKHDNIDYLIISYMSYNQPLDIWKTVLLDRFYLNNIIVYNSRIWLCLSRLKHYILHRIYNHDNTEVNCVYVTVNLNVRPQSAD